MSSIVNKVKDALHHDKSHETPQGTHGPHSSKVANTADPRVDSDRDHRANPASSTGMNTHATNPTMAGTHGTTGTHGTSGLGSTGTTGITGSHGTSGLGSTGTTGITGSHGTSGYSTNSGPHGSNTMNKVDPRVDSDRDHRAAPGGMTGTHGGMMGTHGSAGAGAGLGSTGPGPAANTAGPHKSDMMNKVDPRVDSDLDGSKTVGQDKTYQRSAATAGTHMYKDPTDAAQVPPSVLRKTVGDPVVEHDDHLHARDERHRRASAQDNFRGI